MALKILTVDDSKTIRMIVKKAFKPYDCDLFEGENGVEGLAIASREKPEINISLIKLIILAVEKCRQSEIYLKIVGNSKLSKELKGLAETAELPVYHSVKEARAAF